MSEICRQCMDRETCSGCCAALMELAGMWQEQNLKDRVAIVRSLGRRLGLKYAERSAEMKRLAEQVLRRYPGLSAAGARIGYVMSYERKGGAKRVFGDCRKLAETYKAYLPFDFIITFYASNAGRLDENQQKILMYHELRHIGRGPKGWKIIDHDVEDFDDILRKYGLDWSALDNRDAPDILVGLDGDHDETGEESL
jgi:hypothetical protein